MKWFIIKENDHQGPFEEERLREMRSADEISDETLIWKEGMGKPEPYKDLFLEAPPELPPEVRKMKKAAPPPPPPRQMSLREMAQELEKDSPSSSKKKKKNKSKKSSARKLVFLTASLLCLGLAAIGFYYLNNLEPDFPRPSGMGLADYERLKEVASDDQEEIRFAWALSRDKSKVWMSMNIPHQGEVKLNFASAPGMILSDEEVLGSSRAILENGLAEFKTFQFESGQRIIEGRYLMEIKGSNLEAPLLYKLAGSGGISLNQKDVALLSLMGEKRFEKALEDFLTKSKDNASEFWEELAQKYLTIQAISKSIKKAVEEVFKGEGTWEEKVAAFEKNYTQNYGSFFTNFVIQNEKSYEELEEKDFPDKVSVISYYTRLSRMAKRFGGETMSALDRMKRLSGKSESERKAAQEEIMSRFDEMTGAIDEALKEITSQQNAI